MELMAMVCAVCDGIICEGNVALIYTAQYERLRDGAYDVDGDQELLTVCEACEDELDVTAHIRDLEGRIIARLAVPPRWRKPSEIHVPSSFDCEICGATIPDGEEIFTTTVGRERLENGILMPEEASLGIVVCGHCAESRRIPTHLEASLATLTKRLQRESFLGLQQERPDENR